MKDKEKQIFDKYGNYNFPTEIKQEGLNSATSQIEEMCIDLSKTIYMSSFGVDRKDCNYIARQIIEQGYRKLPEDSVVLSREELEKLKLELAQKIYDDIFAILKIKLWLYGDDAKWRY